MATLYNKVKNLIDWYSIKNGITSEMINKLINRRGIYYYGTRYRLMRQSEAMEMFKTNKMYADSLPLLMDRLNNKKNGCYFDCADNYVLFEEGMRNVERITSYAESKDYCMDEGLIEYLSATNLAEDMLALFTEEQIKEVTDELEWWEKEEEKRKSQQ